MVDGWGLGLFLAGLVVVAVELGYPRRYLGVLGLVLSATGLVGMVLPGDLTAQNLLILTAVAAATALIAVPFYRRYAPAVGPALLPDVIAGSLGIVEEPIRVDGEGLVRAGGIVWPAKADNDIAAGTHVRILVIESDRLWVEAELDAPTHDGDQRDDEQRRPHG